MEHFEPISHDHPGALRDSRQRYVRASGLLLLCAAVMCSVGAAFLHIEQPRSHPLNQAIPMLMGVAFSVLLLRFWLRPAYLLSTIWLGWMTGILGLATPAWWFAIEAWSSPLRLIDTLPPVTPLLLPLLLVMAVFARPRFALQACLSAWLLIATPVLAYLLLHPDEFWTPRGLDLVIAFGPASLFIPLLIPLLRGVERRLRTLQADGVRLQALAERDPLLDMHNRRAGERFLDRIASQASDRAGLILFDIDRFKRINDTHGHPAGDRVLIEIGRRAASLIGSADLLIRWGGEEFLIVMPGATDSEAEQLAQRLCRAVREPPVPPVGRVTASFGVTTLAPGDDPSCSLQRVDEALYRAKANGRDRVERAGTALPEAVAAS
jgi:diguanylate cyclase (GGDEF)-like protein